MDLHAQSLGRSMMLTRGGIAFVVGVTTSNQSGISATSLVVIWGLWALADGAATLRQAYPPSGTSRRAEAQPVLLVVVVLRHSRTLVLDARSWGHGARRLPVARGAG